MNVKSFMLFQYVFKRAFKRVPDNLTEALASVLKAIKVVENTRAQRDKSALLLCVCQAFRRSVSGLVTSESWCVLGELLLQ